MDRKQRACTQIHIYKQTTGMVLEGGRKSNNLKETRRPMHVKKTCRTPHRQRNRFNFICTFLRCVYLNINNKNNNNNKKTHSKFASTAICVCYVAFFTISLLFAWSNWPWCQFKPFKPALLNIALSFYIYICLCAVLKNYVKYSVHFRLQGFTVDHLCLCTLL